MPDWALHSAIAFPAGFSLGLFYFGGLFWTLKQLVIARRTKLLLFGSYLVRLGVALSGFYLVSQGYWERIVICLLGFLVARFYLINRLGAGNFDPQPGMEKDVIP